MHSLPPIYQSLFLLALLLPKALASPKCPLLGPAYPAPQSPGSSTQFRTAAENVTSILDRVFAGNNAASLGLQGTSFSINVFSVADAASSGANSTSPSSPSSSYPSSSSSSSSHSASALYSSSSHAPALGSTSASLYSYHHTDAGLNASSAGVDKVDENTVYRVGSITKVFTALEWLIVMGDMRWSDPETADGNGGARDPVDDVDWAGVTMGELASHMGGIGRDDAYGELTTLTAVQREQYGLPPLSEDEIPTCDLQTSKPCSREAFFKHFLTRRPVFAPSTSPSYSNVAFQLLGYALENVTGKAFGDMLQEDVLTPLGLSRTSFTTPNNTDCGVIPGNTSSTGWDFDLGDAGPAGSVYSTTTDLSTFGASILRSTLLTPAQTRRWLKPLTHTSSLRASVGAPWEIQRLTVSAAQPYRIVDLYTKAGNVGAYNGLLVLSPDHDAGFVVLAAGDTAGAVSLFLGDVLAEKLIPAFEEAARQEAAQNLAGNYVHQNTDGAGSLNSSITLTAEQGQPGLGVQSWVSNGTDMLKVGAELLGGALDSAVDGSVSIRLYPAGLRSDGRAAFRGVYERSERSGSGTGVFEDPCYTVWAQIDALTYGGASIDEFLFEVRANGTAVSVEPRPLRARLVKV